MTRFSAVLLLSVGLLTTSARAELDGRSIALNCLNCHSESHAGADSALPVLQSLTKHQIRQVLLDYKYDRKPATLMPRLVKGYSDTELAGVADYLGAD